MHRRLVALAATALVALAACSAAAPAISDPSEIVTQSLDALSKAKTVHARADVTGTLPFDAGALLGGLSGGSGTPSASGSSMDLAGTYLDATVDIGGKKGTVTIAIPFLLGTKLDLIMDGDTSYTRISLFGDKWQKSIASPEPGASPSPSQDAASMVADVKKLLSQPDVKTEKLADEKCGEDDCYHVRITAPASALAADASGLASGLGGDLGGLAGGLTSPAPGASPLIGGDVTIDWWARKSDLRPMKIVLGTTAEGSTLAVTVTMDKWDEAVTVSPPPADQVTEGPVFEMPSFEIPSIAP
jgi:hypothetical protein